MYKIDLQILNKGISDTRSILTEDELGELFGGLQCGKHYCYPKYGKQDCPNHYCKKGFVK